MEQLYGLSRTVLKFPILVRGVGQLLAQRVKIHAPAQAGQQESKPSNPEPVQPMEQPNVIR